MDVVSIIAVFLVGLLLGGVAAWLLLRSRTASGASEHENQLRAEAANARSEAATARADLAQQHTEVERARGDAADARTHAMAIRAEMAQVQSLVATAEAERDAAVQRAAELAADRESLLAQFKVMSNDVLDRQSKVADASAEQRLKATEQIMAPDCPSRS